MDFWFEILWFYVNLARSWAIYIQYCGRCRFWRLLTPPIVLFSSPLLSLGFPKNSSSDSLHLEFCTAGKFLKNGNTRPPHLPPENFVGRSRNRHGTTDRFKIGKGVHQAVYCYPAYLTYMQSTSLEMSGWMNHSWNQDS